MCHIINVAKQKDSMSWDCLFYREEHPGVKISTHGCLKSALMSDCKDLWISDFLFGGGLCLSLCVRFSPAHCVSEKVFIFLRVCTGHAWLSTLWAICAADSNPSALSLFFSIYLSRPHSFFPSELSNRNTFIRKQGSSPDIGRCGFLPLLVSAGMFSHFIIGVFSIPLTLPASWTFLVMGLEAKCFLLWAKWRDVVPE